ncbi:MAG: class I SAM-dependent methyltransferase [Merismopedia sp. SIO2A8]|nr:class I SAM-dependent methyltransferase [Merismopedia sp. SIO2A8]
MLELLNPQPHESILDLGCGDGALTEQIAKVARDVIGIDFSPSMVEAAQARGLNVTLMSGEAISYQNTFDAVFSNAALHWMSDFEAVLTGVHSSLKQEGRFVGEFGGSGNIATLIDAMKTVVGERENMGYFRNPWFFPETGEYKTCLERHGFLVKSIELIPRPTPLKTGVKEWLKIFANYIISGLSPEMERHFLEQVERLVRPTLYSENDGWVADYVRLRFYAIKV